MATARRSAPCAATRGRAATWKRADPTLPAATGRSGNERSWVVLRASDITPQEERAERTRREKGDRQRHEPALALACPGDEVVLHETLAAPHLVVTLLKRGDAPHLLFQERLSRPAGVALALRQRLDLAPVALLARVGVGVLRCLSVTH